MAPSPERTRNRMPRDLKTVNCGLAVICEFTVDCPQAPHAAHHRGGLVAKSTGAASDFSDGDRVFHQKFGNVTVADRNKLTIAFDRAGEERVVDSFVEWV